MSLLFNNVLYTPTFDDDVLSITFEMGIVHALLEAFDFGHPNAAEEFSHHYQNLKRLETMLKARGYGTGGAAVSSNARTPTQSGIPGPGPGTNRQASNFALPLRPQVKDEEDYVQGLLKQLEVQHSKNLIAEINGNPKTPALNPDILEFFSQPTVQVTEQERIHYEMGRTEVMIRSLHPRKPSAAEQYRQLKTTRKELKARLKGLSDNQHDIQASGGQGYSDAPRSASDNARDAHMADAPPSPAQSHFNEDRVSPDEEPQQNEQAFSSEQVVDDKQLPVSLERPRETEVDGQETSDLMGAQDEETSGNVDMGDARTPEQMGADSDQILGEESPEHMAAHSDRTIGEEAPGHMDVVNDSDKPTWQKPPKHMDVDSDDDKTIGAKTPEHMGVGDEHTPEPKDADDDRASEHMDVDDEPQSDDTRQQQILRSQEGPTHDGAGGVEVHKSAEAVSENKLTDEGGAPQADHTNPHPEVHDKMIIPYDEQLSSDSKLSFQEEAPPQQDIEDHEMATTHEDLAGAEVTLEDGLADEAEDPQVNISGLHSAPEDDQMVISYDDFSSDSKLFSEEETSPQPVIKVDEMIPTHEDLDSGAEGYRSAEVTLEDGLSHEAEDAQADKLGLHAAPEEDKMEISYDDLSNDVELFPEEKTTPQPANEDHEFVPPHEDLGRVEDYRSAEVTLSDNLAHKTEEPQAGQTGLHSAPEEDKMVISYDDFSSDSELSSEEETTPPPATKDSEMGGTETADSDDTQVQHEATTSQPAEEQPTEGPKNLTAGTSPELIIHPPITPTVDIFISTTAEIQSFFQYATASTNIPKTRTIEIHLNAQQYDEFDDDFLAIALNCFHPINGHSPHNLRTLRIRIKGQFLYTRYNYLLVSPAASEDITNDLHKFFTTDHDRTNLPFVIQSLEKAVPKALLGIRDIGRVEIDGRIDAELASLLKTRLTTSEEEEEEEDVIVPDSIPSGAMSREGPFYSTAYWNTATPYPTANTDIELSLPESTHPSFARPSLRKSRRAAGLPSDATTSTPESSTPADGLTMENMARLVIRQQDSYQDLGIPKGSSGVVYLQSQRHAGTPADGQWLSLTGRGNMVFLGWKVDGRGVAVKVRGGGRI